MLPWWGWVLLWAVILVGGGVLVGLRARRTWRSAKALTAELGRAGELVSALEAAAHERRADEDPVTAVTQDPHRLREEHRARRAAQSADRAVRRAERMPPWARVD
ncbi:hypothetical protein G7075_06485 [Phycicoccus sp. HDW14]|uniref:hypothetical protein n=1 Tax=Phycicoccus sp. HDW14 TaxID=2714941 RepID=UPI00140B4B68|nr:hypothetical protein [Phycicoccus sp. HDW14]QIM20863.1 hypothetical protein G7075_06485 [Phycicoccus sp. HDW14]